jgi:hypothetical protein
VAAISSFLRLRIAPIGNSRAADFKVWNSLIYHGNEHPSEEEVSMNDKLKDRSVDEFFSKIGLDATATFDNSTSNPTEHASSEATNAATAVNGNDEELEEEDDDDAAVEEDDELDEEEDVEDEAGV